jgi:hypothetical protein
MLNKVTYIYFKLELNILFINLIDDYKIIVDVYKTNVFNYIMQIN